MSAWYDGEVPIGWLSMIIIKAGMMTLLSDGLKADGLRDLVMTK